MIVSLTCGCMNNWNLLANVGKDASSTFARACGIFVIYLTTCANDYAREQKRQTITANDVLAAMKELDFDEFTPQLETFLKQYRADEQSKKDAKQAAKNLVGKKSSATVVDNVKTSAEEKDEGTANQPDVKEPEGMNVDGSEEKGATAVPQEGDSDMHVDEAKTDQENQSIEMED